MRPEELRLKLRQLRPHRLVVFAVDTSDSMGDGPEAGMRAALGAALALAGEAYLNRDLVSLVTFRGETAQTLVPPTSSVARLRRSLGRLPVGGATPLAAGIRQACQVIRQARAREPGLDSLLVLISDGEATVPLQAGGDPHRDCLQLAQELARQRQAVLLIDTASALRGPGLMPRLAALLQTDCHRLRDLHAGQVLALVEARGSSVQR